MPEDTGDNMMNEQIGFEVDLKSFKDGLLGMKREYQKFLRDCEKEKVDVDKMVNVAGIASISQSLSTLVAVVKNLRGAIAESWGLEEEGSKKAKIAIDETTKAHELGEAAKLRATRARLTAEQEAVAQHQAQLMRYIEKSKGATPASAAKQRERLDELFQSYSPDSTKIASMLPNEQGIWMRAITQQSQKVQAKFLYNTASQRDAELYLRLMNSMAASEMKAADAEAIVNKRLEERAALLKQVSSATEMMAKRSIPDAAKNVERANADAAAFKATAAQQPEYAPAAQAAAQVAALKQKVLASEKAMFVSGGELERAITEGEDERLVSRLQRQYEARKLAHQRNVEAARVGEAKLSETIDAAELTRSKTHTALVQKREVDDAAARGRRLKAEETEAEQIARIREQSAKALAQYQSYTPQRQEKIAEQGGWNGEGRPYTPPSYVRSTLPTTPVARDAEQNEKQQAIITARVEKAHEQAIVENLRRTKAGEAEKQKLWEQSQIAAANWDRKINESHAAALKEDVARTRSAEEEKLRVRNQSAKAYAGYLASPPKQQQMIAAQGGWKGVGTPYTPSSYVADEVRNQERIRQEVIKTHDLMGEKTSAMGRFWSRLTGKAPEFLAQILKYAVGFQVLFGAIQMLQNAVMFPVTALKQGFDYLQQLQDRTADIKEALLENVKFSDDWVHNTQLAGQAAEFATKKIMEVAAKAAIPPEKIEAAYKGMLQGGGLRMLNGDMEQAVNLSAKFLSLMRSRGVSETNQRRAVTEINNLMTGQVKNSSVLLQVLGVTTEQWKKIRAEAQKTGDLLGTHVTATETVNDRMSAVDDRLANAQNRWKDLNATLTQYKNQLFAAWASPLFEVFMALLQRAKKYFEEHKEQLLQIATMLGTSVANMAQLVAEFGNAHNPLMTIVTMLGKAAIYLEDMLDTYITLGTYMGKSPLDFKASDKTAAELEAASIESKKAWESGDAAAKEAAKNRLDAAQKQLEKERQIFDEQQKAQIAQLRGGYTLREDNRNARLQEFDRLQYQALVPAPKKTNAPKVTGYIDKNPAASEDPLTKLKEDHRNFVAFIQDAAKEEEEYVTDLEARGKMSLQEKSKRMQEAYAFLSFWIEKAKEVYTAEAEKLRPSPGSKEDAAKSTKVTAFQDQIARENIKFQDQSRKGTLKEIDQQHAKEIASEKQHTESLLRLVDERENAINARYKEEAQQGLHTQEEVAQKSEEIEKRRLADKLTLLEFEWTSAGESVEKQREVEDKIAAVYQDYDIAATRNVLQRETARRTDSRSAQEAALAIKQAAFDQQQADLQYAEQHGATVATVASGNVSLARSYIELLAVKLEMARADLKWLVDHGAIQSKIDEQRAAVDALANAYKNAARAAKDAGQKQKEATSFGAALGAGLFGPGGWKQATHKVDENGNTTDKMDWGKTTQAVAGTINKIVSSIQNIGSAFEEGTMQGIGQVMQSVAQFLPPMAGQIVGAIGGIISMIGGLFTAAARKTAEQIRKEVKKIMSAYNAGTTGLADTIDALQKEREDAIRRLSGKKGGKKELDKLLPEMDDQIASLKKQQKEVIDNFNDQLAVLQTHSDTLGNVLKTWQDISKTVKEYLQATTDADKFSKAALYTQLQLEKLKKESVSELNSGEQEAIQEVLKLNDLLDQRNKLVEDFRKKEFDAQFGTAVETRQSAAVAAGQQLAKDRKDYEKQLADLNEQIDLAAKSADKYRTVFQISSDISELHRRDEELQLAALDEQISKYKDLVTIIQALDASLPQLTASMLQSAYGSTGMGTPGSNMSNPGIDFWNAWTGQKWGTNIGSLSISVTAQTDASPADIAEQVEKVFTDKLNLYGG